MFCCAVLSLTSGSLLLNLKATGSRSGGREVHVISHWRLRIRAPGKARGPCLHKPAKWGVSHVDHGRLFQRNLSG